VVTPGILIATANLYRSRAGHDERYVRPRNVLDDAVRRLGFDPHTGHDVIANSPQFILLRTSGTTGEPKLLRHPMDFHESVVAAGVRALDRSGMLDAPHTCVIAISRGRLSGGFLFVYEVARRCGWSILLLGASDDAEEIADLCARYAVDTVFMAPNGIGATFSRAMRGRFDGVREILYIGEVPSPRLSARMRVDFPHIRLRPFIYSSNDTGPIGIPASEDGGTVYEVPENVLLEIEEDGAEPALNGTGQILVSVLGLEDPKLIRWRIGDVGTLRTDGRGKQLVEVHGRGEISVKFHLDAVGGSVILQKSVVVDFLKGCDVHGDSDVIVNIRHHDGRTVVDVNIVSEDLLDLDALGSRFNRDFPVRQLLGRFSVRTVSEEEARAISPGKRRFFVKSY
jgi:phenylacetate-coenzyme A ligase PaaK-like adenylate-forming protein